MVTFKSLKMIFHRKRNIKLYFSWKNGAAFDKRRKCDGYIYQVLLVLLTSGKFHRFFLYLLFIPYFGYMIFVPEFYKRKMRSNKRMLHIIIAYEQNRTIMKKRRQT